MPATVLKVRYESSLYAYGSLAGAARAIWTTEGPRGFFAGCGATAVRDAPYAGLYVVVYERCKVWLGGWWVVAPPADDSSSGGGSGSTVLKEKEYQQQPQPQQKQPLSPSASITINFTSGVIAAVVATALTNPFDAVKTRVQLLPGRYGNMIRAGQMMVREEGVRSLFDGLGLRVGRKALSSALAWTGYEELVKRRSW